MSTCSYLVHSSGNTSIIAIVGTGSYVNCGALGEFLRQLADRPAKTDLVVDFNRCTALDSTVLGLLTRTALDLSEKKPAGRVIFVNLEDRPLEAVKNLGLHHVAEVVEGRVKPASENGRALSTSMCSTEWILEAHRALTAANKENEAKFRDVIDALASMP